MVFRRGCPNPIYEFYYEYPSYNQSQTLQAADSLAKVEGQFTHLYTKNTSLTETVSWTTNIRKNFDMNFSAASNYTIPTHTSIAPASSTKDSTVQKNGTNTNLNSFSETPFNGIYGLYE